MTMHSSDFNYENVVKRLKQARLGRPALPPGRPTKLRSGPAARSVAPRRPSLWSRMTGTVRDEAKQMVAASLALLGFGVWLCSSAQALYDRRGEATLAGACHDNQLAHAGAAYCFDDRRIVHTLKDDGTATKPGLDWRVNENALRKAESEERTAAHAARNFEP
jgi:hypothetical protein